MMLLAGAALAGPYEDARSRFASGDYQAAATLLEQAREQDPENPLVYAALGDTYRRLGNNADALRAYDEYLKRDPGLSGVRNRRAFLNGYQAVGGDASRLGAAAAGENSAPDGGDEAASASDLISALSSGDVFVGPELRGEVDEAALAAAVQAARPTVVKVVALRQDAYPWLKQYRTRDAFADDLRQRLNLPDDGAVIVGTPKGIAASSGRLSREQLNQSLRQAGLDQAGAQGGLTGALVTATRAVSGTAVSDRRTDTGRGAGLLFGGLAVVAGIVGWRAHKRKKEMDEARGPVEALRQEALTNLSYVDGYLDLLPAGEDAERARALRQSAYEKYATASGVLKTAKAPDELRRAEPLLQGAVQELTGCREAIDRATGGTGVAMRIPELPSLKTDEQRGREYLNLKPVEQINSEAERESYQRMIEQIPPDERGVSFFSGQPMPASELVPVEIVIGGQKRTVMASRYEAEAIARGETPPVRAFEENGQYIPWYEYRGYDPYRDYYRGGFGDALGTFVSLYAISSLLGPAMWVGYSPWGYGGYGWGMPMSPMVFGGPVFGGYYCGGYDTGGHYGGGGYDGGFGGGGGFGGDAAPVEPEHAGSFDFFGGALGGGGGEDQGGGGFDFGGGGGDDGGGFDFGSSDSGGGFDFGGGDSGGGGGDW
jgi:tetratricopeptide (TPR) repeat protein